MALIDNTQQSAIQQQSVANIGNAAAAGLSGINPLLGIGVGALSSAYNIYAQNRANKQNIKLANTQYQRAVDDMKAAGLNPALMYGKGASTSPTPNQVAPQVDPVTNMSEMLQLKALESQINLNNANAQKAQSEAEGHSIDNIYKPTYWSSQLDLNAEQAKNYAAAADLAKKNLELSDAQIQQMLINIEATTKDIDNYEWNHAWTISSSEAESAGFQFSDSVGESESTSRGWNAGVSASGKVLGTGVSGSISGGRTKSDASSSSVSHGEGSNSSESQQVTYKVVQYAGSVICFKFSNSGVSKSKPLSLGKWYGFLEN